MRASVIGSGSFGTAIAHLISSNAEEVMLFGKNSDVIKSINRYHTNYIYHPSVVLNDNIKAYHISSNSGLIKGSDIAFFCVPSGAVREVSRRFSASLRDKIIISTAKGIEYPSLQHMSRVIKDEINNENVFSFSGPTFSDELIKNSASGATLGISTEIFKKDIMKMLDSSYLLVDYSRDVEGVELCGILKNIYAVGMGIIDSFINSYNEHYLFLTLCFKEMNYILESLNHRNLSNKFCAFGDFNLTSNTDKSRNRSLGLMIGKNMGVDLTASTITLESLKSTKAMKEIVGFLNLNVPIMNFVGESFNRSDNVRVQIRALLKELSDNEL